MRHIARTRWRVIAALSLLTVPVLLMGACRSLEGLEREVEPGQELFAVDPAQLLELSFRTSRFRMIAYRWKALEPFTIVHDQPTPDAFQHCVAGEGFERLLRAWSSLRAAEVLAHETADEVERRTPPDHRGVLRIHDSSRLEDLEVALLLEDRPVRRLLILWSGKVYAVTVPPDTWEIAAGGCRSLSDAARPAVSP